MNRLQHCLVVFAWLLAGSVQARPDALTLYLNADLTHASEASGAIARGIEVALSEVDNRVQGMPVKIQLLDHRGNATRQRLNSEQVLGDAHYLAMFSGIHSTTLIPNREFINQNNLLTLVPWAAGGPITRFGDGTNWVFRLSLDDSRAGPFLVDYAMREKRCRMPHLLLEDSPWGESNFRTMGEALRKRGHNMPHVTWFNYSLSPSSARILLRDMLRDEADCVLLVANDHEARTLMDAMDSLPEAKNLNIISHWGMVAGEFWKDIGEPGSADTRMRFIQSCFTFNGNPSLSEFQQSVFARLQALHPEIRRAEDLRAQVGFVHAYDLTRLLLAALQRVTLGDDMTDNRARLRDALEHLDTPVQGLIRSYRQPFGPFDSQHPDAHEALGPADYCMGRFGDQGVIYLEPR